MAKRKDKKTGNLFIDGSGQLDLLDKSYEQEIKEQKQKKVECLGQTFENDDARREYFTNKLREGLVELHNRLAVPYEDAEQAFGVLKSVKNWPMGEDARLRKLAEKMRFTDDSNKDILRRWKDEIGFPHGEIDDIINLSDSPYYTACPNPFLGNFVKQYGRPYDPTDGYKREPFATDVKEGKNDPIYNAHSYHTKVPHKAIMRYILHYTEPGDLVFDGFCGTGMTGVAAQMCGNRAAIESLGYEVKRDGAILDEEGKLFSKLGARKAILNDLSPAATFIAYNYNASVDTSIFKKETQRILKHIGKMYGWAYLTLHKPSEKDIEKAISLLDSESPTEDIKNNLKTGIINYTVWSELFSCPECATEITYLNETYDPKKKTAKAEFNCPSCRVLLSKSPEKNSKAHKLERVWETKHDRLINSNVSHVKLRPVLINYSVNKKRFEKEPDKYDLDVLSKISTLNLSHNIPTDKINEGDKTGEPLRININHVHQFYYDRGLLILGAFLDELGGVSESHQLFLHGSVLPKLTKMNRYMPQHGSRALVGPMANTLYFPPLCVENNVMGQFDFQFKKILKALNKLEGNIISTHSANEMPLLNNSVDYLFIDPPFGANIMYSELSFIREAWLKIFTVNKSEAIVNKTQKKNIDDYRNLMVTCFNEAFRALKPGHWMTVEFSNTKASVWNSIQLALEEVGFVVASVDGLDKTRGGLHAMIGPTAVKQDLIISAYKPNGGLEERFEKEAETEAGVWDFIRTHMRYLTAFKGQTGQAEFIPERDPRILYDKLVAYYVRHGISIPVSSGDFQAGLRERFAERDGMYFLPDQAVEYDRKRMLVKEFVEAKLFVDDEASAIQWLRQQLLKKPQRYNQIQPQFMQQISGWNKNEQLLELSKMLEDNFLRYDGNGDVPSQIHSYLSTDYHDLRNKPKDDPMLRSKAKDRWYVPDPNKEADLEKKREKALLREFEEYRQEKKKKLKIFRLEAVRAGFKKAYQDRDYQTIIDIAEKIPESTLQEDQKLLMWYDQAITRTGV